MADAEEALGALLAEVSSIPAFAEVVDRIFGLKLEETVPCGGESCYVASTMREDNFGVRVPPVHLAIRHCHRIERACQLQKPMLACCKGQLHTGQSAMRNMFSVWHNSLTSH